MARAIENIESWLRIEIIAGGFTFAGGQNLAPRNVKTVEHPAMGQSIGVAGAKSTGSLGGYVVARQTGKVYALTNGHVAIMGGQYTLPVVFGGERHIRVMQSSDEDWDNAIFAQSKTLAAALSHDKGLIMTREWVAIPDHGITASMSGKGDLGSLLVTKHFSDGADYYDVVGQMFSGGVRLSDTPTETFVLANWDITVMTPAEDILHFLLAVTGEEFEFVCGIP